MSVEDIRNPWIRRPLIILIVALWLPIVAVLSLGQALYDWIDNEVGEGVRDAWRGPRGK